MYALHAMLCYTIHLIISYDLPVFNDRECFAICCRSEDVVGVLNIIILSSVVSVQLDCLEVCQ